MTKRTTSEDNHGVDWELARESACEESVKQFMKAINRINPSLPGGPVFTCKKFTGDVEITLRHGKKKLALYILSKRAIATVPDIDELAKLTALALVRKVKVAKEV